MFSKVSLKHFSKMLLISPAILSSLMTLDHLKLVWQKRNFLVPPFKCRQWNSKVFHQPAPVSYHQTCKLLHIRFLFLPREGLSGPSYVTQKVLLPMFSSKMLFVLSPEMTSLLSHSPQVWLQWEIFIRLHENSLQRIFFIIPMKLTAYSPQNLSSCFSVQT